MESFESEILLRIRNLMRERKITQKELSTVLKTRQYNISRMLNGHPFPSLKQLYTLSTFFDVSIYYLIGVQEQSYRKLTPKAIKIISAYETSSDNVKMIIDKILDI